MIDPLRFRSLQEQLEFVEDDAPLQCWQCLRERMSTPAFFLCHECGKVGASRPFCEPCFFDYHLARKRGKDKHKPHPIVQGDPVLVQTLADGDGVTFAKMHDWVTLDYTLTTDQSDVALEDTFLTKQPLTFQSGCSGPCIHLQLFGCTEIAAADIMGASDPYCAVYWKNNFVGVTSTKHMTLNPRWANQTFVLPLTAEFIAAVSKEGSSSASTLFDAGALLPNLRIELYDWDRLSKDDFLGQATVSDAEILQILLQIRGGETDENQIRSFDLKPKHSSGQLGVRVALRGSKLYIHVMQAQNLPKADPFSLSDPYCEVYWNDRRIGKTAHIDDTLDPIWDLEIFSVKVDEDGPKSIEQSTLRIVCLDWDQFGSDDVLGQIELAGWQIRQLAESKYGDEDKGAGEGAIEEADIEGVFGFLRTLQEHETDEAGLGKMVVGVPQDPNILKQHDQEQVSEEAEVDPSPKKKKRQQKRKKHEAAEADEQGKEKHGVDKGDAENHQTKEPRDSIGSGMDATTSSKQKAPGAVDTTEPGAQVDADPTEKDKASETAAAGTVPVEGTDDEGRARQGGDEGVGERERQRGTASAAEEESRPPFDQKRRPEENNSRRTDGKKVRADASVLGEGQKEAPGDGTGGVSILGIDALSINASSSKDGQAQLTQPPPKGEKVLGSSKENNQKSSLGTVQPDVEAGDIEEGNTLGSIAQKKEKSALENGATDTVSDQPPSSRALKTPEPLMAGKERLAQDMAPPDPDRVEGDGQPVGASAPASPPAKREKKAKLQNSVAFVYRDANVQRFEEDRGVLVEYLDDGSSAWVYTKFIPRLQIRVDAPIPRNMFRRLWDQRKKVLNLHKRILNVKRGMKVLMGVAMTGSRMQWYQLELTDEQSGANFVRGTVNCRFLYHTRGSVLRGLDVAVSHMSLGERARIEVRSDYGFGEVYASRNVPPYANLVFVAQVAAIRHHSAKWLVIRRALRDMAEDALFRFRSYLSSAASSYSFVRRFLDSMPPLRRYNNVADILPPDDEESMGTGVAVEEDGGPRTRDTETKLL